MKTARIVLIEDNPADVLLVEMALKQNGVPHDLTKFRSGEEGARALCAPEDTGFVPDAILLDLNTPKSDGFAMLGKLKRAPRLAGVPIAVITSSCAQSDRHRTELLGSRFIRKPAQLKEFLATVGTAVREMIDEGRQGRAAS